LPSKKSTEVPAVAAVDAPAVPPKDEEETAVTDIKDTEIPATTETTTAKVASPTENRRKSYFGSLGQKKDGETSETEKPLSKFTNMFRKPSQANRGNKKENVAPVEQSHITEKTEVPAVTEEPAAKTNGTEPEAIGDVVPEAVSVGHSQSTPTVAASA